MQKLILVINTGSSSIKFSIFEQRETTALFCVSEGEVEGIGESPSLTIATFPKGTRVKVDNFQANGHTAAMASMSDWIHHNTPDAVWTAIGHRVVHGGRKFVEPVIIDDDTLAALQKLIPLDPLHQPISIAAIQTCKEKFLNMPQIACFDTAFHATQPAVATAVALPQSITKSGVRRYGFHGLSYEYITTALQQIDPKLVSGRTIIAHLGNGASLCAAKGGKSIATTMGFSVLDGLVMGTRCGSIDPGILIYMLNALRMSPSELETVLYKKSGLLGASGLSNDVRTLLASDDPKAKEALELYVYRIVRETGSLIAALGGIDGIVFTGGVGENSAFVREQVAKQLSWLGLTIDSSLNAEHAQKISTDTSKVVSYVIKTDENLAIARHVVRLLKLSA